MDFGPVAYGLDPLSIVAIACIIIVLWSKSAKNWGF
jgi:hypothetical protein